MPNYGGTAVDTYGNFVTVVEHGATASTTRPTGAVRVFWRGTVAPTNATQYDRWINTTSAPYVESIFNGATWDVFGSATYARVDVVVPAPTGVAATDLANLNAAVTACPVGGVISLANAPAASPYVISGPWVINKPLTVLSNGVFTTLQGQATNVPDNPVIAPFLLGTVIKQTLAGANIIEIPLAGKRVNFRGGLGLIFADAIKFVNTGHGIYQVPPVISGSQHDTGIEHFVWEDIFVFGHDGNHYAFYSVNALFGQLSHLRSLGGGVMHIECDSGPYNTGNLVVTAPYGHLICGGSAHGYHQKSRTAVDGGLLNLNVFIRPQVNINVAGESAYSAATAPTNAQYLWMDEGPTGSPRDCLVIAPDLEGYPLNSPIQFGTATAVHADGGLMSRVAPYISKKPRVGVPTVVSNVNSGGTTLGTSSIDPPGGGIAANDERGQLTIRTGVGNGGANGGAMATVTLSSIRNIGAVMLTPVSAAAAAFQARVVINGPNTFQVWNGAAVGDNSGWSWLYHVIE